MNEAAERVYWITGLILGAIWFIGCIVHIARIKKPDNDEIYNISLAMSGGTITAILVGPFILYIGLTMGAIIGIPYFLVKLLSKWLAS